VYKDQACVILVQHLEKKANSIINRPVFGVKEEKKKDIKNFLFEIFLFFSLSLEIEYSSPPFCASGVARYQN
jgi:hypothetical protein